MPEGVEPLDLTSYDRAGTLVEEFEACLGRLGVEIESRSDLESVCLELLDCEYRRLHRQPIVENESDRIRLRKTGSVLHFVRMFLRAEADGWLNQFMSHIEFLNTAVVPQNMPVPPNALPHGIELPDDVNLHTLFERSNKLVELFVALMCCPIASEVILDDPHDAQGDNPDVLAQINGRLWGFAFKVPGGVSPITLFERLEGGVQQIDTSPADVGAVFFSLRNAIQHDLAWPEDPDFQGFETAAPVIQQLKNVLLERRQTIEEQNGRPAIDAIFANSRCSVPAALAFLETSTIVRSDVGPMPTTVVMLGSMRFAELAPADQAVFEQLNESLHLRI